MLSSIAYSSKDDSRAVLDKVFAALPQHLHVLTVTNSLREASRFAMDEKGALLLVAGLEGPGQKERELALIQDVYQAHRDSYIVALLASLDDLQSVLAHAVKLSGVLMTPIKAAPLADTLKRIVRDYRINTAGEVDGETLVIHTGGTAIRLPKAAILYVEAQSKKLDIWTRRECVSIYQSMESLQNDLGSGFLRCHRSYLVNRSAVKQVHYADMTLVLFNGTVIPFSRSNKAAVKAFMMTGRQGRSGGE